MAFPNQGFAVISQIARQLWLTLLLCVQDNCGDGTPIDSQSELELGKYYENIGDYKRSENQENE